RLWPTTMTMPDNAPSPLGYVAWGRSWIAEEYQRPGWGYPVNRFAYKDIVIDPGAYDSVAEQARVEALLAALKEYTGKPFPPAIDDAFRRIPEERAARDPVRAWLTLPL